MYLLCYINFHLSFAAIKQRYQKFFDSGAASICMEIVEVGPMGGDNNMAYDRGYVQVLNAQQDVIIDGKYVRSLC